MAHANTTHLHQKITKKTQNNHDLKDQLTTDQPPTNHRPTTQIPMPENTPPFDRKLLHPKHWGSWLAVGILWLLVRVLPYHGLMAIGSGLGRLMKITMPYRMLVVKTNLEHCFSQSSLNTTDLFNQHVDALGKGIFEMAMGWFLPAERFAHKIHFVDDYHVSNALKENRGVLLLGMHTTHIDFGAPMVTLKFPTYFMYRKMKNPVLDYIVSRRRILHSQGAIEQSNMRALITQLQAGQCVWYAADQDFGSRAPAVFAPFFGVDAYTLPLYAKIARKTNAAVIPVAGFRNAQTGQYEIRFLPEIPTDKLIDEAVAANAMNQAIETLLTGFEAQYYWVHRRFKTRPTGESAFYPRKPSHIRGDKKALKAQHAEQKKAKKEKNQPKS
ncbi:LpxL/LpxP family acyltransferase [Ostreibacterium oceani]|uniref:Kdo(2)-lipid IV(A) lauroyltransferase n=1 Tax=Ostreibacterium oceani TaxID=2654998 RepID=A0A6N7EZV5_9GAMM|nr:lysophospholipid acyltransferase family protein [Ostreibacterium oceani]MPV86048.1 hypothetical protein [Ostreibacterium oceani]